MYNLSAKRPSLAPPTEENVGNKPTKTLRKKKIVQLTPQQVRQFQGPDGTLSLSPRSPRVEDQEEGEEDEAGAVDQQQDSGDEGDHPQVNFNIFPYYYDVVKHHQLLKSPNIKDQIRGAQEIGEVAWNGGELSQTFIGKCGVLKTFATLLDSDSVALKMALSVVCRANPEIQDQLVGLNFVQRLYSIMCDHDEELRKWATHALFYLLNDCEKGHAATVHISELKHRLEVIQRDNWASWNYNDAKEILKMLRLRSFDE